MRRTSKNKRWVIFFNFIRDITNDRNTEKVDEKLDELFAKVNNVNYTVHPSAKYTSRLLDFKNLPEPQNSKKINEEFWNSRSSSRIVIDSAKQKILAESEEFTPIEIKEEYQTYQETPSKQT